MKHLNLEGEFSQLMSMLCGRFLCGDFASQSILSLILISNKPGGVWFIFFYRCLWSAGKDVNNKKHHKEEKKNHELIDLKNLIFDEFCIRFH